MIERKGLQVIGVVTVGAILTFAYVNYSSYLSRRSLSLPQSREERGVTTNEDFKSVIASFDGIFEPDDRVIPSFLTGDFNGDDVMDIAIPVRLAQPTNFDPDFKPHFRLYRPIHTGLNPEDYPSKDRLGVLSFYLDRSHVIVVHGEAGVSWGGASESARHVLLDFPGIAPNRLRLFPGGGRVNPAIAGDQAEPTPPPEFLFESIVADEVFEEGVGGLVYWDGIQYRLYPFKLM